MTPLAPLSALDAARKRAYKRWGGNLGCCDLAEELGRPTAADMIRAKCEQQQGGLP